MAFTYSLRPATDDVGWRSQVMTFFYHIVEDDPLDSGSGSRVIQGTPQCTIEGHDGRMRNQTFIGHLAYCGVCQSTGKIVQGNGTPRDSLRMYDETIQAREAVEGDIVLCKCERPPKLIAVHGRRSYIHDVSAAKVDVVGEGAAFTLTALAARSAGARYASSSDLQSRNERHRANERRCALRIGVFFDGTGNNAGNTDLFAQCKASSGDALGQSAQEQQAIAAHCEPYMLKERSSYEGGYTNVWRLYQLYRDSATTGFNEADSEYFIPIYIDGIGTTAGKPDTLMPGYAFGTGETGMLERVKHAITVLIPKQMELFGQRHPDAAIEAIEFDAFGFSRGAAAARHFVNEINRKRQGPLASALPASAARFTDAFDADHDVRVGFVGLFDTVVSYASLADGFNVRAGHTGSLRIGLPAGCARKVVQIAARDEHRANFMLTTVVPQHQEIPLPGVHSDIGGGYRHREEGPLMLIEPVRHDEPLGALPALRNDLSQSRAWREVAQQLPAWKQRLGGIDIDTSTPPDKNGEPAQALTVDAWLVLQHRQQSHQSVVKQTLPTVYATLRLKRSIEASYQLIALRMMHKLAIDAGVMFKPVPNDQAHRLPDELQSVATKLLAGQLLDAQEQALLARKYLHQSAHWNILAGKYQHSGISLDLLYPNRPERDGQRKVLPNR
ncbi:MAG: PAAR domain-containing protein [Dyella sp.]|uniref:PAAR domain-containing protein n=1 Tax=Dyella sp. TaxID=1869338 RepID=UPI003F7D9386